MRVCDVLGLSRQSPKCFFFFYRFRVLSQFSCKRFTQLDAILRAKRFKQKTINKIMVSKRNMCARTTKGTDSFVAFVVQHVTNNFVHFVFISLTSARIIDAHN